MPDQKVDQDYIKNEVGKLFKRPGGNAPPPEYGASELLPEARKPLVSRETMGRVSNAANMGVSGAQMGSGFGLPGMLVGGAAGAGVGALLPPSDSPGADTGTTLAELAASRFLPPGAGKMARFFMGAGAGAAGASIGALTDEGADFVSDTPYGKIALYSGASGLGLMSGKVSARPVENAADALKASTGVEVPLSFGERVNSQAAQKMEAFLGGRARTDLAKLQNTAGQAALEKIIGKELGTDALVDSTIEVKRAAQGITREFAQNPENFKKGEVAGRQFDWMTGKTKNINAPEADWEKFDAAFGLKKEERNALFEFIQDNPDAVIDKVLPAGDNKTNGVLALRALFTVLPDEQKGKLGAVFVNRLIQKSRSEVMDPAMGDVISGKRMLQAISDFGEDRLKRIVGPERAEALRTLGVVMAATDPAKKLLGNEISFKDRAVAYLTNKNIWAINGAMGSGASAVGSALGGVAAGAVAGAVIAVPTSVVFARVMQKPELAKLFAKASTGTGNATDITRLVRTLTNSVVSDVDEKKGTDSTARSRLEGLFQR